MTEPSITRSNIEIAYKSMHQYCEMQLADKNKKVLLVSIENETHNNNNWTASSEFGTYRLCEQRRFRRACASAQSRQNLRCSLIEAVSQEEPWDRKPDPWPLWMTGHAQLKFVMTECSKTQIRLTGLNYANIIVWFQLLIIIPILSNLSSWRKFYTLINSMSMNLRTIFLPPTLNMQ